MAILLNGSICLSDLIAQAKQSHSAFSKASNGKIYVNITQWINDEPDKFGNISSIQLNSSKDKKEVEGKIYIGNCKKSEATQPAPIESSDLHDDDSLPF